MSRFEDDLRARGFARTTAATYGRCIRALWLWMEGEGLSIEAITYRDLVAYLRTLALGKRTKNLHLTAIRHYMAFEVREGRRSVNPAVGLVVRGTVRRLPRDLLTEEQLKTLYQGGEEGTPVEQRDKAMLSLMIYQALTTEDLARLTSAHVDLVRGLLHVPPTKRSNQRVLLLEAHQVLTLHRYLVETRPALLRQTGKTPAALFFSCGSGQRLHNALARLMRRLRLRHSFFKSARQLRASRITLWLRHYDLREVQYRAGHRYVSSTERYQQADLEDLHRALEAHHPLA